MDLTSEEYADIVEEMYEWIHELVHKDLVHYSNPDFKENVISACFEYFEEVGEDQTWYDSTDEYHSEMLREMIEHGYMIVVEETLNIPPRQVIQYCEEDLIEVVSPEKLAKINNVPSQEQRTKEWYEARREMFSASNLWKLFGSEAMYNSLIYEKCKPLEIRPEFNIINNNSPLSWGIKYEPVTAMIYEHKNNCKVNTNYGCIPHEKLPIGASPDGIVDKEGNKFGRMVEIKNIYNREITGVPSEEYWIQMQIQMETAKLPYCDFVETRIKEFENFDQYIESEHDYKGVVLVLSPRYYENKGKYLYKPLEQENVIEWIKEQQDAVEKDGLYYIESTLYWYLDEYSCVLVERNREWFYKTVPVIEEAWETVKRERVSGYFHRAPKKQKPKNEEEAIGNGEIENGSDCVNGGNNNNIDLKFNHKSICLIKIDENGNIV